MSRFARAHLSDTTLLCELASHAAREQGATADLLADLAELESRKLHYKLGYGSLFEYCVQRLHLSEHSAFKRINAARTARRFPAIFERIADGRLNLTAVLLLGPRLNSQNVEELLDEAANLTKAQVLRVLARRFPKELSGELAPERVNFATHAEELPVGPDLWELVARYGPRLHGQLHYLRDLLSHQIPSGKLGEVLDRAVAIAIGVTVKRKFSATDHSRSSAGSLSNARSIPAHVKKAVWRRDRGRCTYVSPDGRRCGSRWQIEYDHRQAFARGGDATVDNVRLLCRAHNQYAAETTFGSAFMQTKRPA